MNMNRVLKKRIPRDLKENLAKYAALILLIAMGMYMVISMVASAETVIIGTESHGEANCVEDGQFSVFIPLTSEQEEEITDKGFTLERQFSLDIEVTDGSRLRVMRVRKAINLIELDSGNLPVGENECVLEKRYAQEHNLSVGDSITASDTEFTVVGVGSAPDYDAPYENLSDTAISSKDFGVMFVTDERYDYILNETDQKAEDYTYAYRLGEGNTSAELKEIIRDFEFDYKDVTDKYYLETIDSVFEKRDEISDGINSLYEGSAELSDGLKELYEGSESLTDGLGKISDGASELAQGASLLEAIAPTLTVGITALESGINEVYEGSKALTEGAKSVYEGSAELSDGIGELKEQSDELLDEIFQIDLDNLTSFIEKEDNIRIGGAAGDVAINKTAGLAAGVLIMIIFTYVISVFVVHQIQRESSVIGTLYALGAKKKDLILHYIALPTIITFIGGLIGTCIGFSPWGMDVQTAGTCDYFSVPEFEPIYSTYLIIYGIVMPPVIAALTNALVINKRLSRTALSLIRNEQKEHSYSRVDIKSKSFIRKFQLRQIIREMRTSVTVVLGMVLSLLILMLVTDTYFLCINIGKAAENDVMYEYMYTLKYPTEDIPEGGEACYVSSLSKTENGYSLDVTVMGIDEDNPYFPTINTHAGKSSITASTAAAQRYGLKVGDKLILDDDTNEISYVFTVEEIGEYGAGLMVFMDIDSMRELFGEEEDYYNCVLSDKALDIDEGRLYSTVTKADVEKASGIILDMMQGMIVSMSVCAVVICFTVMYLMQSVMIDRAAFGISLVKTFGYRTKEVKKLYLNGNFYTAVIGAIIGIPLSKVIIDGIFPMLVSNVASGVDVAYPWQTYLLFFAGIMLIYFIVNIMLVRKLNRITPAEVLKNRE